MQRVLIVTLVLACFVSPAWAEITVTFEEIAKTGDQVPGREALGVVFNGRAFQPNGPGVFSRPCVNNNGDVAFMARSSLSSDFNARSAIGIYLKPTGLPLVLIADQSTTSSGLSVGAPFRPPGRSDSQFTGFLRPLINNRGDVLFYARFSGGTEGSGSGFYVYRAFDQQIIRIVDSLMDVPGFSGTTFNAGFSFSNNPRLLASMNDQGDVVFLGRFRIAGEQFEDQGYYGTNFDGVPVTGGTLVRLADTTGSVSPTGETDTFRSLAQGNLPAINNSGDVIFEGQIGPTDFSLRRGVFIIPVDGTTAATTLALQFQPAPLLSDGVTRSFSTTFGGHDINDARNFLFQHRFGSGSGATIALFAGDLDQLTDPLTVVADTQGGFVVPGQPTNTDFTTLSIAAINESGELGFYARDNGPVSDGQGIYAANIAGFPFAQVAYKGNVPPGQAAPAAFNNFQSESAAINDLGNLALDPNATNTAQNDGLFGLWFYDTCTGMLELIVDRDTSGAALPVGLGETFVAPGCAGNPCERDIRIFDGFDTRSGHQRSINNNDDVAFLAAFSTFNVGVYVAHVESSGGVFSITCPPDVTEECTTIIPGPEATGNPGVCVPEGSNATVSFNDVSAQACGGTETITRTWTATLDDAEGSTASCDQIITTIDSTPPEILGVPDDASVDCDALPPPASPSVDDICDPDPVLAFAESDVSPTCGGGTLITRTWSALDACGNVTTRSQIISQGSDSAPVLTVPANVDVECGGDTSPASTGQAGATADCRGDATVTFSDSTGPGACGNTTVITRTWTATDVCGNAQNADQIITVVDNTAPIITAPTDVTVECDSDLDPAATGTATATDVCGGTINITFSDETTGFDLCGAGLKITRTWTATDACDNSSNAVQVITLVDTTAPVITAPTDVAIDCEDQTPALTGTATVTDNCDDTPMLESTDDVTPGACPFESVITRTWVAMDDCGNESTATQVITVQDNTAPILSVPSDMTIECDADSSPAGTGSATATDNCDTSPVVTSNDSGEAGTCPAESVITRTWTATDACSNASSEVQVISVQDTTAPAISASAADQTVECDGAGNTVALNAWLATQGGAVASDNCGTVTWSDDFTALTPGCAATGTATVNFTADDDCGNEATATTATFTIEDNTPPTLTLDSSEITVVDTDCSGQEPVTLPDGAATDDCGDVTVTNDGPAEFPAGETTVVNFTATDDCGNDTTATADVTVKYGANIEVHAHSLRFSWGCYPDITKEPLVGITVHAYARPGSEHCSHYQTWWCGWHWWRHVVHDCDESEPVNSAVTDENGVALIDVPPGDYIIVSFFDFDGDGEVDHYLGRAARGVECGQTVLRRLRLLITSSGTRIAARIRRYTGSELLIAEPDMMIWDDTEQEYPFGFESEGDWGVSVTVAPPEGFVSDYEELSEEVASEIDAVQFTVTEIGSDLVPTQTSFVITHNGRREVVNSNVGILLTPDYAESRGFNANELRKRGLIIEKRPTRSPLELAGPEEPPATGARRTETKPDDRTSVGSK